MSTPIEKAAEYLIDQFCDRPLTVENADKIAHCLRSVLEAEVPEKVMRLEHGYELGEIAGHNDCRRLLGLDDW